MGGHHYRDAAGERVPAVVTDEFELVISLSRWAGHGPGGHVEHHCVEMPDAPLSSAQIETVCLLADTAVGALRRGLRVLVRCRSGYNRSGLVVAQGLMGMGYSADDAVQIIRQRRSPWALNNQVFVDYLTTGLDVARLLAGLDALSQDDPG
ncbi:dual specificity protein phosphatase family protein [Actinomadura graeca]|uniref:Dual specificity protein phosphatase family protein n=2 Tax=Actinomadura graeca TaxID=2750812 RepID=A0ABX8R6B5_9ACTN|nr:dual specificity protein phosphatase family protein [Actinomadura graeca]